MWTELFEASRSINPYLGVVALVSAGYRLAPGLFALEMRNVAWRFILLGYIFAAGLGAAQGQVLDNEAGPVSFLFTVLHVGTTIVCLWFPPTTINQVETRLQRGHHVS